MRRVKLPLEVHGSSVTVESTRAEVTVLVTSWDADDDAVARVGRRRSDTEDLSWDDDVGLEAELVVGDAGG